MTALTMLAVLAVLATSSRGLRHELGRQSRVFAVSTQAVASKSWRGAAHTPPPASE